MFRLGETPYVSTLPLYHALGGPRDGVFELVPGRLTELATQLSSGQCDVGPIIPVDYFRAPERFRLLPGLAVSSLGRSGCVLLFSRRPVYELGDCRIAVPGWATGAVNLLRWLMAEMYRFEPTLVDRTGSPLESLAEHDAVLAFQDQALEATAENLPGVHVWDLGEAWWQITNTPLIYMLWAARAEVPQEEVAVATRLLNEAKADFASQRQEVVARAASRLGVPATLVEGYLGRFSYDFTPAHQEGMATYATTIARLAMERA